MPTEYCGFIPTENCENSQEYVENAIVVPN